MAASISKFVILLSAISAATDAYGQSDPYHITDAEKAACTADAVRLCASAYPDEKRLLVCMQANKPALSSGCVEVFDAGIKRRHLGLGR